jgi:membrane protease subunit (stomatin/prohibitin family)
MWTRNQCDNTEDKLHRMNSELIDIQNTLTKYQDTKKVDDIKNEAISDMVNALVKTTGRMNERIQEMIEVLYK